MRTGGDAAPGPARPNCATQARSHTRARARAGHAARRHLVRPPSPRRPADSPFSSNKDINPTLLARDWDEVRRARTRVREAAAEAAEAAQRAAAGPGAAEQRGGAVPATSGVHTLQRPGPGDLARREGAVSRGRRGAFPASQRPAGVEGAGRTGDGARGSRSSTRLTSGMFSL